MAGDRIFNFHGSAVFNDIHDNKDCTIIVPSPTDNVKSVANEMATAPKAKKKPKCTSETDKSIRQHGDNYAVFGMGSGFDINRTEFLRKYMLKNEWISPQTSEYLFRMLFDDKVNDCEIQWTGNVGKGNLKYLFESLVTKRFIILPKGYGVNQILEAHFVDKDENFITSLNSSKVSDKLMPLIDTVTAKLCSHLSDYDLENEFDNIVNQASDSY